MDQFQNEEGRMTCDRCQGQMRDQEIRYVLEMPSRLLVIEHVPAKVCSQCGEQLFAPGTVERLQQTAWEGHAPVRVMQTPVFDFAA